MDPRILSQGFIKSLMETLNDGVNVPDTVLFSHHHLIVRINDDAQVWWLATHQTIIQSELGLKSVGGCRQKDSFSGTSTDTRSHRNSCDQTSETNREEDQAGGLSGVGLFDIYNPRPGGSYLIRSREAIITPDSDGTESPIEPNVPVHTCLASHPKKKITTPVVISASGWWDSVRNSESSWRRKKINPLSEAECRCYLPVYTLGYASTFFYLFIFLASINLQNFQ